MNELNSLHEKNDAESNEHIWSKVQVEIYLYVVYHIFIDTLTANRNINLSSSTVKHALKEKKNDEEQKP